MRVATSSGLKTAARNSSLDNSSVSWLSQARGRVFRQVSLPRIDKVCPSAFLGRCVRLLVPTRWAQRLIGVGLCLALSEFSWFYSGHQDLHPELLISVPCLSTDTRSPLQLQWCPPLSPRHAWHLKNIDTNRIVKFWKTLLNTWFYKDQVNLFLRQEPPLDLSFWSFLTFLHHGIEEVERHLLWKFYKKKFEGKIGQMCHWSRSLAYGFYTKLYTKSAVSESSIALARLNLIF